MLKVGITGGIGSGKTTVCQIFEILGIPVYYADERAKGLMTTDPELIAQIKKLMGPQAYLDDGSLNRSFIAGVVFNDRSRLALLNALVHPAVARDSERWHQSQGGVPYTLKEAALLFESGSYQALDQIICVTAPLEVRVTRVRQRDQVSKEAVMARIDKQMPEAQKVAQSDFVIHNTDQKLLIPQVLEIHSSLCRMALAKEEEE